MVGLQEVLTRLARDLAQLQQRWALVGGLAVSVRAEPRTTRDVDVAVAVSDDRQAEKTIQDLQSRGYTIMTVLEHEVTGRLATVRMLGPLVSPGEIVVDILFASSGAEQEVVADAEDLEVLPGTTVPVATLAHLLALKVLAGRAKDLADIESLMIEASDDDVTQARRLLTLINHRGCARNRKLDELAHRLLVR